MDFVRSRDDTLCTHRRARIDTPIDGGVDVLQRDVNGQVARVTYVFYISVYAYTRVTKCTNACTRVHTYVYVYI